MGCRSGRRKSWRMMRAKPAMLMDGSSNSLPKMKDLTWYVILRKGEVREERRREEKRGEERSSKSLPKMKDLTWTSLIRSRIYSKPFF
jgi:hypothetical protein